MQTQRIAISLVLSVSILISCNHQKNQQQLPNDQQRPVKQDTLDLSAKDALSITEYSNNFTDAITQQFIIQPQKLTVVTGKKGLKITVDPSSLVKEDGSAVDGKIGLRLVELTSSDDLFRSNAATVSDGKLLASGGSYFIGMECNGQKLRLKEGRSMQVSFPVLKKNEMELFYGERNEGDDMNWKKASMLLKPVYESISFADTNPFELNNSIPDSLSEMLPSRVYKSLDETVYYYKRRMTLQELVDTLNRKNAKVYLQTISYWPKKVPGSGYVDSNYLRLVYGPRFQYILKRCKDMDEEERERKKRNEARDSITRNWKPQSLAGQLQKYYAPAGIQSLGWINCDRFYKYKEQTDVDIELPIALNESRIEYFIIYRSFNGLINARLDPDERSGIVLQKMPVGESVTLIAFAKSKGTIYECKKDFVIEKDKKITAEFKTISLEELKNIFAGNVRI